MNTLAIILTLLLQTIIGGLSFDKTVHDFGDVFLTDGALSCTFTASNPGNESVTILSVVSSCGCTDVSWTHESIVSGKSGKITATYANDEGAFPFDKTLTVYTSASSKPVILHLRGNVHEKERPLSELFPVHYGALALKSSEVKLGNMQQGEQKSGSFEVANISSKSIRVSFSNINPQLSISCNPATIPAGGKAKVTYTVTASRELWGKNWYYCTPLVNGSAVKSDEGSQIGIWAITKENFSSLSKEERRLGSSPKLAESTVSFGKMKAGKSANASFEISNTGKKDLVIYKADFSSERISGDSSQLSLKPGESANLEFKVDTKGLPKGEQMFYITLYTNSPLRPMVNMYIAGIIQ